MNNELTNLLPPERLNRLSHDYLIRLATVVVLMVMMLVLVATILLLPSYVFLSKNENAKKSQLMSIGSETSSDDEKKLSTRLSLLSDNTKRLVAMNKTQSISTIVNKVLAINHSGISLSGFSYTSAVGDKSGVLVVSGTASTRGALRNYQLVLESSSFALSANLPVSAYAKDSQIEFSITITLAP